MGRAPTEPTRVGNKVFFAAEDPEHGRELWVSDGTAPGDAPLREHRKDRSAIGGSRREQSGR
jgi:hypothetical protein